MNSKRIKSFARGLAMTLLIALLSSAALPVSAAPGDTTRVSVDSAGVQGNASSSWPAISSDGRFVAFQSDATNLVTGDTNAVEDIFVYDRQTAQTTRVSVDGTGAQANGGSAFPALSSDGRFVAFASDATNLVANDTNAMTDIFVRDRQAGTTTRASVDSAGVQANGISESHVSISGDGRFVVFYSDATNLVANDTNGVTDVFLHDMQTGATERISVASDGTQADGVSFDASISANGLFVVFTSGATNLVIGDTNLKHDIFVRDRQGGITSRVSVNSSGVEGDKGATDPSISGDGRYVTFSSASNNLLNKEPLANEDLYVRDRQSGTTTLVSQFPDGYEMVGWSEQSMISANGRYVTFEFDDRGDGDPFRAIYVRDLFTGQVVNISGHGLGTEVSSYFPSISGDGRFVAFTSNSNRLVSGDTNGVSDVFVNEVLFGPDLAPKVSEVKALCGLTCTYPSPATFSFRVTFSELVTGVTADDFKLTTVSGNISGASVTGVTGDGSVYQVTINTGTGDGSLRLDVLDDDSIKDVSQNPLGGIGAGNGAFSTGDVYLVDKSIPAAISITRSDPTPTAAGTVHFAVTFSESVSGVDVGDFVLTASGVSGAAVTQVDGGNASYVVTVNTGAGDGTLRLDLVDNDSIFDAVNNPLGGAGAGNANFTSGETYTINRSAPTVVSVLRSDPNPTAALNVRFTVTFSEPVTGVDPADFALTATGVSGASVLGVSGSGNVYSVNAGTGTGDGSLGLDVLNNNSIVDALGSPLVGTFTTGEAYTIQKTVIKPVVLVTETYRSNGTNDGWVLESTEDGSVGGTVNNNTNQLLLGDDAQDRQFRVILHFPTQYLPDNAVVTRVILMIKGQGVAGTNPFTTHQNVQVDINKGLFGPNGFFGLFSLQPADFQAPSSKDAVGVIANNPVGGWYWSTLDATAYPYINLTGATQIRLRFQLDDNDNQKTDVISFFSGDDAALANRPQLMVEYYVQK